MNEYDVAIIGGGIHGAGVLQAAAARGHRAVLIERTALASGTSSRSSKLIHGGLRYLESAQFHLVYESLRERAVMLRIAPELVELKEFFIPVYRHTRRRPWQLRLGLSVYAILGGFKPETRFGSVPRQQWPALDGLELDNLDAVIRYQDAQTDDRVLTQAVVRSACSLGADVVMPANFVRSKLENDRVRIVFQEGASMCDCLARVLVNAAGPWASHLARFIKPAIEIPEIELVQGTHIIIPVNLKSGIFYVESPSDGRAIFIMPWHGETLIGTTETPFRGEPEEVHPLPQEEEYLLDVVRHYFPHLRAMTRADITGRFAGLRVLPASGGEAFARSRETMLVTDRDVKPRVLTIFGGKLTAWRATAEQVMDRIETSLPRRRIRSATQDLVLRRST